MRRRIGVGAGDEVDEVGVDGEAGPDLAAVDAPVRAVTYRPGAHGREVRAGVGLAQPDAPAGPSRDDVGDEPLLLLGGAVLRERRADLAIADPRRGDRCAGRDQRLGDDEPLEAGASVAAVLDGQGHAEPSVCPELERELPGVPRDPGVLAVLEVPDGLGRHGPRLGLEGGQLGGQAEVHAGRRSRSSIPFCSAVPFGASVTAPTRPDSSVEFCLECRGERDAIVQGNEGVEGGP